MTDTLRTLRGLDYARLAARLDALEHLVREGPDGRSYTLLIEVIRDDPGTEDLFVAVRCDGPGVGLRTFPVIDGFLVVPPTDA